MIHRIAWAFLLGAMGCCCAHAAAPSPTKQQPDAAAVVARVLSVALERYALENPKGVPTPVCVIGDSGQPWPQSALLDLPAKYRGRPNCRQDDALVVALVTETERPYRYTVDVRQDYPPCGPGPRWECWIGPRWHVVYEVWGVSPNPLILAYRALVLDGNLVGSETEYETRTRLVERRLGAAAE
jgi:hypothetical protein